MKYKTIKCEYDFTQLKKEDREKLSEMDKKEFDKQ